MAYVPSSAYEPDLAGVPSSSSLLENILFDTPLDTNSDDENPPPFVAPPTPAPQTTPQVPRWVHSTREAIGDLNGDPIDKLQTCSQL